jgi:hypothetical protein
MLGQNSRESNTKNPVSDKSEPADLKLRRRDVVSAAPVRHRKK